MVWILAKVVHDAVSRLFGEVMSSRADVRTEQDITFLSVSSSQWLRILLCSSECLVRSRGL